MTQPDEIPPGQPLPPRPTETEPTQPQATETDETVLAQPLPTQEAAPAAPAEPVPAQNAVPAQPLVAPAPQPGYAFAPAPVPGAVPLPSPEELAAAAARKAKRRGVFVKSAVLAVPAVVLVVLLAATGIQANALSSKTKAASTAAKAATAAGGLAAQLHAAQSAAEASILVDAGCVAVESDATKKFEDKLDADGAGLDKAAGGTSFSAFSAAVSHYINDLQALSTNLQQDAALSKRSIVTSAVGTVNGDLKVVISTMQDLLAGNASTSVLDRFNSTATRMDADATAVDTLCGGSVLNGTSGSSLGTGSLSA